LLERGLEAGRAGLGGLHLMVTDRPKSFGEVAARFLGEPAEDVEPIDL
jgi:glutamate racemase